MPTPVTVDTLARAGTDRRRILVVAADEDYLASVNALQDQLGGSWTFPAVRPA